MALESKPTCSQLGDITSTKIKKKRAEHLCLIKTNKQD